MSTVISTQYNHNRANCSICNRWTAVEEHHWQYQHDGREEITIDICRECHDILHVGARPKDFEGYAWLDPCVSNLIELEKRHNEPESVDEVLEKYDLPEWYSFDVYSI